MWAGHPSWTRHETVRHEFAQERFDDRKSLKIWVVLRKALGKYPKPPAVEAIMSPVRAKIEIDFATV